MSILCESPKGLGEQVLSVCGSGRQGGLSDPGCPEWLASAPSWWHSFPQSLCEQSQATVTEL